MNSEAESKILKAHIIKTRLLYSRGIGDVKLDALESFVRGVHSNTGDIDPYRLAVGCGRFIHAKVLGYQANPLQSYVNKALKPWETQYNALARNNRHPIDMMIKALYKNKYFINNSGNIVYVGLLQDFEGPYLEVALDIAFPFNEAWMKENHENNCFFLTNILFSEKNS
jgi:hypothetical protein